MSTRLEQIKARLEKATSGPWKAHHATDDTEDEWISDEHEDEVLTVESAAYGVTEGDVNNCELIAHAPDDLAALLAVVEAAERWEEAQHAFDNATLRNSPLRINTLKERRLALADAVRAFREEGER